MLPVDFKGEKNFCLDQEGEGVPGRGAHVRVKACVIDGGVFREQRVSVGRAERGAGYGEP